MCVAGDLYVRARRGQAPRCEGDAKGLLARGTVLEGTRSLGQVDMWALGELLFRVIAQRPVFPTQYDLFLFVFKKKSFPSETMRATGASQECCQFVTECMSADPILRLSASQAAMRPWMRKSRPPSTACRDESRKPVVPPSRPVSVGITSTSRGFESNPKDFHFGGAETPPFQATLPPVLLPTTAESVSQRWSARWSTQLQDAPTLGAGNVLATVRQDLKHLSENENTVATVKQDPKPFSEYENTVTTVRQSPDISRRIEVVIPSGSPEQRKSMPQPQPWIDGHRFTWPRCMANSRQSKRF